MRLWTRTRCVELSVCACVVVAHIGSSLRGCTHVVGHAGAIARMTYMHGRASDAFACVGATSRTCEGPHTCRSWVSIRTLCFGIPLVLRFMGRVSP